jgi:hypothetical protein
MQKPQSAKVSLIPPYWRKLKAQNLSEIHNSEKEKNLPRTPATLITKLFCLLF